MRSLALMLLFATPLAADAITDVRGALTGLKALAPIHGTYELERNGTASGKLDNDKFGGKVLVDVEGGPEGFQLIFPQALLEEVEREQQAEGRNSKIKAQTARALGSIDALETSQALDFAPVLLRLIEGAKVVSDAPGTFQGKPVRAVVLRVLDRLDEDDARRMKISENRLTLWLGPDHVPVGAEHLTTFKFSFLIFRWEQKQKKSWYLAHVADRLLRIRFEDYQSGSGMGQKTTETTVATLRVRS
ncbi:MAG: hypothetical protein ABI779_03530 [Acidobacteriota bacterium]